MGVIEKTSEAARRSWGEFLDQANSGQLVTVLRRGRRMLDARSHTAYLACREVLAGPEGDPVRIASATDPSTKTILATAKLIVVSSDVAKDIWHPIQVWVAGGGHAILERYGAEAAVLTPPDWAPQTAAPPAATDTPDAR